MRLVPWALLIPLLLGCSDSHPVRWLSLARGQERPESSSDAVHLPDGRRVEFEGVDGQLWGTVRIPRDHWSPTGTPGVLRAPVPLLGLASQRYRLEEGGREFRSVPVPGDGSALARTLEPGTFGVARYTLYVGVDPDVGAPEEVTLHVFLDARAAQPGRPSQVLGRRFSGRGFSIWPGEHYARTLDLRPGAVLSFATTVEVATAIEPVRKEVTFRVRVDDRVVYEHAQPLTLEGSYAWHSVPMPEESRAHVVLEVEGPFAYTAVLDPVLGPAPDPEHVTPQPPSIVLFVADTFRADNLVLSGGAPDLAPQIDAFAQGSLRFDRAWSTGTTTLTGLSSIFSGLYPRQTATDRPMAVLPDRVETIAEILARKGYRTGAITDSGNVSQRAGFYQGFGWFDEAAIDLDSTLARARDFLAADDGRPVFLLVQSYRAHRPYRAREGLRSPVRSDAADAEYQRLWAELRALGGYQVALEKDPVEARRLAAALGELYRQGVTDLDRGFGAFWRDLRARGYPEQGYVVFTSDHGESFLEHDQMFHPAHVFEEAIHVPLLIAGPDITPGVVSTPASLVDLAPTFAAMAGAAPLPFWQGMNLLEPLPERTLFAFECANSGTSTVAALRGGHKLIALEDTDESRLIEPWMAFDLERDPRERTDVLGSESWPHELFDKVSETVEALLVPLVTGELVDADEARRRELDDLGYGSQ